MTDKKTAQRTAEFLLDIGAVHIRPKQPFTLTSGAASPVYIDCRKVISFLDARREIVAMARDMLAGVPADYIAGGETAGIPYAAWISEALSRPMLYVRKKPKGFGRNAQIEGEFPAGARVLLVEDLTTDGGSKIAFINALRDAGAVVTDVFSVFFYGIFPRSAKIMADAGLTLRYLTTWQSLIEAARDRGLIDKEEFAAVQSFLDDPEGWSAAQAAAQ